MFGTREACRQLKSRATCAMSDLEHIPRRQLLSTNGDALTKSRARNFGSERTILFGKITTILSQGSRLLPSRACAHSDAIVIRECVPADHWHSFLTVTSSDDFVAHAVATSNGTKMPRANWNVLVRDFRLPLPPMSLMRRSMTLWSRGQNSQQRSSPPTCASLPRATSCFPASSPASCPSPLPNANWRPPPDGSGRSPEVALRRHHQRGRAGREAGPRLAGGAGLDPRQPVEGRAGAGEPDRPALLPRAGPSGTPSRRAPQAQSISARRGAAAGRACAHGRPLGDAAGGGEPRGLPAAARRRRGAGATARRLAQARARRASSTGRTLPPTTSFSPRRSGSRATSTSGGRTRSASSTASRFC